MACVLRLLAEASAVLGGLRLGLRLYLGQLLLVSGLLRRLLRLVGGLGVRALGGRLRLGRELRVNGSLLGIAGLLGHLCQAHLRGGLGGRGGLLVRLALGGGSGAGQVLGEGRTCRLAKNQEKD